MSGQKLVRDKIPEIIAKSGATATFTTLDSEEYVEALHKKLQEEVDEYLEDRNTEELADILEVVYALSGLLNTSPAELEAIRQHKAEERGGFAKKLFLVGMKKSQ